MIEAAPVAIRDAAGARHLVPLAVEVRPHTTVPAALATGWRLAGWQSRSPSILGSPTAAPGSRAWYESHVLDRIPNSTPEFRAGGELHPPIQPGLYPFVNPDSAVPDLLIHAPDGPPDARRLRPSNCVWVANARLSHHDHPPIVVPVHEHGPTLDSYRNYRLWCEREPVANFNLPDPDDFRARSRKNLAAWNDSKTEDDPMSLEVVRTLAGDIVEVRSVVTDRVGRVTQWRQPVWVGSNAARWVGHPMPVVESRADPFFSDIPLLLVHESRPMSPPPDDTGGARVLDRRRFSLEAEGLTRRAAMHVLRHVSASECLVEFYGERVLLDVSGPLPPVGTTLPHLPFSITGEAAVKLPNGTRTKWRTAVLYPRDTVRWMDWPDHLPPPELGPFLPRSGSRLYFHLGHPFGGSPAKTAPQVPRAVPAEPAWTIQPQPVQLEMPEVEGLAPMGDSAGQPTSRWHQVAGWIARRNGAESRQPAMVRGAAAVETLLGPGDADPRDKRDYIVQSFEDLRLPRPATNEIHRAARPTILPLGPDHQLVLHETALPTRVRVADGAILPEKEWSLFHGLEFETWTQAADGTTWYAFRQRGDFFSPGRLHILRARDAKPERVAVVDAGGFQTTLAAPDGRRLCVGGMNEGVLFIEDDAYRWLAWPSGIPAVKAANRVHHAGDTLLVQPAGLSQVGGLLACRYDDLPGLPARPGPQWKQVASWDPTQGEDGRIWTVLDHPEQKEQSLLATWSNGLWSVHSEIPGPRSAVLLRIDSDNQPWVVVDPTRAWWRSDVPISVWQPEDRVWRSYSNVLEAALAEAAIPADPVLPRLLRKSQGKLLVASWHLHLQRAGSKASWQSIPLPPKFGLGEFADFELGDDWVRVRFHDLHWRTTVWQRGRWSESTKCPPPWPPPAPRHSQRHRPYALPQGVSPVAPQWPGVPSLPFRVEWLPMAGADGTMFHCDGRRVYSGPSNLPVLRPRVEIQPHGRVLVIHLDKLDRESAEAFLRINGREPFRLAETLPMMPGEYELEVILRARQGAAISLPWRGRVNIPADGGFDPIHEALGDRRFEVRERAHHALGQLPGYFAEPLRDAQENAADPEVALRLRSIVTRAETTR